MADKDGNKTGGRQKGSLNKRSVKFIDRMDELDCDPQEFLAKVLTGDEPSLGVHPFYKTLMKFKESLGDRPAPNEEEWLSLLEDAEKLLKISMATLGERIGIAKELLQYIAPKLRHVEFDGNIDSPAFDALALSAKQLIKDKLNAMEKS